MIFLRTNLFFSPLPSFAIITVSATRTKKVCLIESQLQNYSSPHPTYEHIVCYNSFCCKRGCCAWYIDVFVAALAVLGFLLFLKMISIYWKKFSKKKTQRRTNQDEENMQMMALNIPAGPSGIYLQNYGSNANVDYLLAAPPSYEDAVLQETRN